MTNAEYIRLKAQTAVLEELIPVYSGKTLDNVLMQLKARVKTVEQF